MRSSAYIFMKMTNPFSDIEKAFCPFFSEAVVARLKTGEA